MDQATIQRYLVGGDIYQNLAATYGVAGANQVASAAASGDERAINAVIANLKDGAPRNTSTTSILTGQLLTNPLAAPLEGANKVIGNSIVSFLKNPWIVFAVAAGIFFWLGGPSLVKGFFNREK